MARPGRKDRGLIENPRGKGWYVRIFFEGREHRFGIYDTKSAARDFYEKAKLEQKEKRFDPETYHKKKAQNVTVKELIEAYVKDYTGRSAKNLSFFKKYWTRHLGKKRLNEVRTEDLNRLQKRLRSRGLKATATINRRFAFLRRLFNLAIEEGKIATNPVSKVKFFKEESARVRYITEAEELTLKGRMTAEDSALVEFAINTGLRRGEQFGLKWKYINIENRILTIPLSKSGKSRHVPLNDKVVEILKGLNSWLISPWVFPSKNPASPIDGQNFYNRVFIPALEDAGNEKQPKNPIEGVTWHTLRHTFASRLVMAGVDIRTVQELMGHADISMTMKYAHLAPDHLKSAVQKLLPKPAEEERGKDEKPEGEKTPPSPEKSENSIPNRDLIRYFEKTIS
ncbi:MAG: tyrosine-type recombinase/integrase [Nitrospiria bacterium]